MARHSEKSVNSIFDDSKVLNFRWNLWNRAGESLFRKLNFQLFATQGPKSAKNATPTGSLFPGFSLKTRYALPDQTVLTTLATWPRLEFKLARWLGPHRLTALLAKGQSPAPTDRMGFKLRLDLLPETTFKISYSKEIAPEGDGFVEFALRGKHAHLNFLDDLAWSFRLLRRFNDQEVKALGSVAFSYDVYESVNYAFSARCELPRLAPEMSFALSGYVTPDAFGRVGVLFDYGRRLREFFVYVHQPVSSTLALHLRARSTTVVDVAAVVALTPRLTLLQRLSLGFAKGDVIWGIAFTFDVTDRPSPYND